MNTLRPPWRRRLRVDIHKLDRLMNIVGELSIVRTTLARLVERLRSEHVERELAADVQRLQRTFERHLGAMQQGILEVRMVPLGQVFDKLARVVRQISREATSWSTWSSPAPRPRSTSSSWRSSPTRSCT